MKLEKGNYIYWETEAGSWEYSKVEEGSGNYMFIECPEYILQGTNTVVDVVKSGQTVIRKDYAKQFTATLSLNKNKVASGDKVTVTAQAV